MKIIGTGSALPSLSVSNDMLSAFLDTNDEWISTRTGVKRRRILSTETLLDLAVIAVEEAIKESKIDVTDIDYIICSNLVNIYATPTFSSIIQGKIGAICPCLDINVACSGFIYALDIADAFLKTDKTKNVLIVCAEEPSRIVDWTERDASILFGDGAAAAIVTKGKDLKATHLTTTSNIDALFYQRKLEFNPFVKRKEYGQPLVMNGKEIYRLAVLNSISDINKVLEKSGIKKDEVKFFVLHQANMRIIEAIRQNLDQPAEKFPHNLEYYGNTASASIPILLDELNKTNQLVKGDILVLSAFGAGFTTGACVIHWSGTNKIIK